MPGLIIPNTFSLLVHQPWVVAGALAADRHAQDSVRQEDTAGLWIPKLSLAKDKSHGEDQTKHKENSDKDEG